MNRLGQLTWYTTKYFVNPLFMYVINTLSAPYFNPHNAVLIKLRYCILNTVLIIYSCMLSTQCQLLTTTQIYLTLLTYYIWYNTGWRTCTHVTWITSSYRCCITQIVTCVSVALLYVLLYVYCIYYWIQALLHDSDVDIISISLN